MIVGRVKRAVDKDVIQIISRLNYYFFPVFLIAACTFFTIFAIALGLRFTFLSVAVFWSAVTFGLSILFSEEVFVLADLVAAFFAMVFFTAFSASF